MRERELVETLKVRALPEGSDDRETLTEFLRLYCDAVQTVVNRLWVLDKVPSVSTLHRTLYGELRALDFRAHHVKQIYVYARAVVKASRKNGGEKPILRRGSAPASSSSPHPWFPRIGLGASSPLGAFGATPGAPHLGWSRGEP